MWISIKITLKFVPRGPINNIIALVQIMAWCQPSDKPLSELMIVSLLMHIYVTWPQWVKSTFVQGRLGGIGLLNQCWSSSIPPSNVTKGTVLNPRVQSCQFILDISRSPVDFQWVSWKYLAVTWQVCTEALKGHRVVWKIEIYYLIRMT